MEIVPEEMIKMLFITKIINKIKRTKVVLPFHKDIGHGWLEVKFQDLKRFKIEHRVSIYSYQDGFYVYLEEDCDAPLYLNELKKRNIAYEIKVITDEYESFIRGLAKYGV